MKKLLLSVVQKIRLFYWWLIRPATRGVRAIVVNQEGKVLLVSHTYQSGWFLSGGKVHKNESDENALIRELREELGVQITATPQELGKYQNSYEYKRDTIIVFVVNKFIQENTKHFEIEKYKFFDPRILPKDTSPGTQRRIKEWLGEQSLSSEW